MPQDKLHAALLGYGKAIDYILLDQSMGKGVPMNTFDHLRHINSIVNNVPLTLTMGYRTTGNGIACAGGLGPKTLNLIEPIIKKYPNISMDAQSALRPSGIATDPISWEMAEEYLIKALAVPALS